MSTAAPTNKPASAATYELTRPAGKCVLSGRDIPPGEKFMAALRETPLGFERLDISLDAWPDFDRKDVVGFWQTTMPTAEQKKKLFVDEVVLWQFVGLIGAAKAPTKNNFCFLVVLIMMRKKLLYYTTRSNKKQHDMC